ncbi:phosphonate metabolism transcriptional regulator PhnF [Pseudomonas syringae]|uniref:phosphonate metabolism transcriptional regulator PhnF n=1 Tax=Pseudomonas TaxID=286 RepID=UPI000CDA87E6|nr:phosphonate metabolism transcriptional regulator PhnF [Pseudomonas syringae]MCH5486643.1 phosphonate metabolism transcriptional regulator PhnF [Pseudomonas syringae pv. syringae]MDO1457783.1 phosphonate metabolism transcriptional regulator PhnF [Pseudomonas syringae pv. syringae]POR72718.1 phosphonate metabolism transcriptional regulator PhnF [Pseudomonas syringae pv. syringae]POR81780.1 phosphonate metabolism transcriptional regulator PhnF [Pseudomonas syringae pv. syringae]
MQLSRQVSPVYHELANILREELTTYQPGDFLPAEFQLAERFSVNRHTIRRAVDELVREGSVLRRQGKGTQVLERPLIYPMQADSAYSKSWSAQGLGVEAILLRRQECQASREDARHLGVDEHAPLIELQTLRKLDGQAVSLIFHRYSARYSDLLADYRGGSVRQYLAERELPLSRAQSLIGARLPSREEAAWLLMPRHMPALTVLTVSCDAAGLPVELSRSVSRADRFQYQVATPFKTT